MPAKRTPKKAKSKVEAPAPEEAPKAAPAAPKKPKLSYTAVSIGRNGKNRWATMLDHIEDGVVVRREALVEDSTKGTALDRLKITVIRRMVREEKRVL